MAKRKARRSVPEGPDRQRAEAFARRRVLDRYEDAIMFGMTRYLWVYAYSRFLDPYFVDLRAAPRPPPHDVDGQFGDSLDGLHEGNTWDDVTPDAPACVYAAALDLAKLLAITPLGVVVPKQGAMEIWSEHPMVELYTVMMDLETGGSFMLEPRIPKNGMWPDVFDNDPEDGIATVFLAHRFGSGMAAECLQVGFKDLPQDRYGAPGAWFDTFRRPQDWSSPWFRVIFDGKTFTWVGNGVTKKQHAANMQSRTVTTTVWEGYTGV